MKTFGKFLFTAISACLIFVGSAFADETKPVLILERKNDSTYKPDPSLAAAFESFHTRLVAALSATGKIDVKNENALDEVFGDTPVFISKYEFVSAKPTGTASKVDPNNREYLVGVSMTTTDNKWKAIPSLTGTFEFKQFARLPEEVATESCRMLTLTILSTVSPMKVTKASKTACRISCGREILKKGDYMLIYETDDEGELELDHSAIAKISRVQGFQAVAEIVEGEPEEDMVAVWTSPADMADLLPKAENNEGNNPLAEDVVADATGETSGEKERRLFVADFKTFNANAALYGSAWYTFSPSEKFRLAMENILTATRRFKMLDRKNTGAVDAELAKAAEANTAPADLARLGNKLMTDYMVVGQIDFFTPPAPYQDKFTSRTVIPDGPLAKINYRVIFVPTQQLKCSGSVTVSVSELSGSTAAEIASAAMEHGAEKAVARIMEGILPFQIAQVVGNTIVINQGGDTLHLGEYLGVYAQGEKIKDPATGEVIDCVEIPVGDIKITRVTPKLSYAEVCRGKIEDMKVGSILRRSTEEERAAAQEAAKQAQPSFDGKLPFDK